MNNLYRILALIVLTMAWIMPAKAQQQPQIVLTTEDDVANHNETLYWIESYGATGFYMIPHTNNSNVSTTNMPNLKALWYFMDAGIESGTQYYYIVNHNTGYYLKLDGSNGGENTIKIGEFGSGGDIFKFSIDGSEGQWVLHTKSGGNSYWVNKKSSNVPYDKYLKSSNYGSSPDANSKWNFVAENSVTWAHPFTNSTNEEKNYYNIHNATSNGSAYYMSTDDAADPYATVSNVDNGKRIWYFVEAASDNTIPNLKYYYIVNAITGKYLMFTGTANGSSQASSLRLYEHDGTETGETENRFQFMVLNAIGSYTNPAYSIMPKLEISYYYNKNASLSPGNENGNAYSGDNAITLANNMKIGIYNDRGYDNNYAHWFIVPTEYVPVAVEAPTITNNYDGTISLSTPTPNAEIYYTTDGTTPSSSNGTQYTSAFSLGDATVIKAIAYLGSESSGVTTYNVPKYSTPTISFDNSTSQVTITSEGTVYYNTGDGSQDDPNPSTGTLYTAPFTVSSPTTVKAIATHAGYLTSDVAIWSNIQHDYSEDYLTFRILTGGTIMWKAFGSGYIKTIEYSKNNGSWTSIESTSNGATFDVNANDVVRFRGNNTTYAGSKSNYSGFEGGTATFNIEGNIMSLTAYDNFANVTNLPSAWVFCSLFKKSLVISAENLVLPATSLTNYAYRAMFSYCETLEIAPELPATTLAQGCYWYMFEKCAITTAPELNATTLVQECYGNMFNGCSNLNYIKCLATSGFSTTNCLNGWVSGVSSTGTFVKDENTTWGTGTSGIPTNWIVVNEGTPNAPTISCDGFEIELSCTTTEAVIYYQLDHSGNYTQYTTPITITGDTFIECYSEKDGKTSATISQNCEYDDRTIYEYSNQSLDLWTYGGNTITTPYSVNAIDGHSSKYAKGTFNFETDVNLRGVQPTYLWFQHADQSATIYVDNNFVEKHWGGYNAFFVDISNHVHKGTNHIKVALKNNEGDVLAPYAGDFNFNATLGNVKLFTSPYMPSMSYGYDGFHITSTVSSAEATINVKTTIPTGATVVCTISGVNCNYTEPQSSTGDELVFTTTITNPRLWNGTIDPYLYNVKVEIYHDNELYHRYERPYGLRFYEYAFNKTVNGNPYTGFLLNGQPYLLRGVCVHDDLANKANALNDTDYTQEFDIITELGCNFLRLAHYPHPKEVYDKCDQLGIIVQTEAPWVNRSLTTEKEDYWTHLEGQCADMVNQHYNHPCILFWGVGNEINTTYTNTTEGKDFVKNKIEGYRNTIRSLMPNAWVGYTVSHGTQNGLGVFNNPTVDWIGQNIYVGWYVDKTSNNPTQRLTTAINNATTQNTPCAYSEYGCGGTPSCHSDNYKSTTTTGNNPRHDIEYQMWLHEGHIAAIKNKPELLFTSQWQLFDIAVYNRQEGYKVSLDGETVFDNNELKFLNNKGLVERDHRTKKDTYYLYKAWWNQTDKFVHICGKDYEKLTSRVIKCYTNDDGPFQLYVNNQLIDTKPASNFIVLFDEQTFNPGDVIRVKRENSETIYDTFTFTDYSEDYVFTTNGNWNNAANWSPAVPAAARNVTINAACTIPKKYTAHVNNITIGNGSLSIADSAQLYHNNQGVNATVQKNITAYTVSQNDGESLTNGWYFIASPTTENFSPSLDNGFLSNTYDLFYYDEPTQYWRNHMTGTNNANSGFSIEPLKGYLYANNQDVTLVFQGNLRAGNAMVNVPLSYTSNAGNAKGFNLVGNPFAHNVTNFTGNNVAAEVYRMNDFRNNLMVSEVSTDTPLPPGEGFFVKATGDNASITFNSSTRGENVKHGHIALEISENGLVVDRFIVKNEGEPLEKFTLNENSSKIFATRDQQDWAVVTMEGNEQAVNFKAAKDGTYTISLGTENTTLHYLHLIDNKTGNEVDLLQTPSYCFEAKTMDYESRFRLVFNNDNSDNTMENDFAFIHNGEIVINGEGTVQIVDVMGRIVVSHRDDTRPISTESMAPGIYVLRLIQSDKVRTQKIVID